MYYVYVLESIKNNKKYIGSTEDLENRIKKHNVGNVRSTKAYKPYKLIYKEEYKDKSDARQREIFLKSGQGRKLLESLLIKN